jgi:hypothetical protein
LNRNLNGNVGGEGIAIKKPRNRTFQIKEAARQKVLGQAKEYSECLRCSKRPVGMEHSKQ